jgi:hypothetical protein
VHATVGSTVGLLNIVSPPALSGTTFSVSFAGIPGDVYTVETNANLGNPSGWVKEGSNYTAPATGVFEVTDQVDPIATPSLNYRVVYPAY